MKSATTLLLLLISSIAICQNNNAQTIDSIIQIINSNLEAIDLDANALNANIEESGFDMNYTKSHIVEIESNVQNIGTEVKALAENHHAVLESNRKFKQSHSIFYGLWMVVIGLLFGFIFLRLWQRKKELNKGKEKIEGIRYFGFALFTWAISGLLSIIVPSDYNLLKILLRSIFSSLNSGFILITIRSIDIDNIKDNAGKIYSYISNNKDISIVCLIFVSLTFASALMLSSKFMQYENGYDWLRLNYFPDILLSVLTIGALYVVLDNAFDDRGMEKMRIVALATLIITLVAQILLLLPFFPEFAENGKYYIHYTVIYNLFATTFKILLIALILILLYSGEIKKLKAELKQAKENPIEYDKVATNVNEYPYQLLFKPKEKGLNIFLRNKEGIKISFGRAKKEFEDFLKLAIHSKNNKEMKAFDNNDDALKYYGEDEKYHSLRFKRFFNVRERFNLMSYLAPKQNDSLKKERPYKKLINKPNSILFKDYKCADKDEKQIIDELLHLYEKNNQDIYSKKTK